MIAVGLGLIVLCDAATLRREAGRHAELLNHMVEKLNDHFVNGIPCNEFFNYEDGIATNLVSSYAWDTAVEWIDFVNENYSSVFSHA